MEHVRYSPSELGAAICDALGLKQVTNLQINIGVDKPTEVVATVLVPDDLDLARVIRTFELNPVARKPYNLG